MTRLNQSSGSFAEWSDGVASEFARRQEKKMGGYNYSGYKSHYTQMKSASVPAQEAPTVKKETIVTTVVKVNGTVESSDSIVTKSQDVPEAPKAPAVLTLYCDKLAHRGKGIKAERIVFEANGRQRPMCYSHAREVGGHRFTFDGSGKFHAPSS